MNDTLLTLVGRLFGVANSEPVFAPQGDHTITATVEGAGSVSATALWQASNDKVGWVTLATLNPSGAAIATAKASTTESYRYWRLSTTALTGVAVTGIVATESGSASGASSSSVPGAANLAAVGAPFSVYASARDGAAVVQWLAAPGALPDAYQVTASTGQTVTVAATGRRQEATITGLANGVPCTCTVRSIANGTAGAASAASNSVTPSALATATLPVVRGLEMWWSAGQVTGVANGASLATLADFSGNGYNAAGQGGGGTWVANWSNGKPAVSLNGTNQYYHTLASGLYGGMRKPDFTAYALFSVLGTGVSGGRVFSHERGPVAADPFGCFAIGVVAGGVGGTASVQGYNNQAPYSGASFASGDIANNTPIRVSAYGPGGMRVNGAALAGQFVDPRLNLGAGVPWSIGAMYAGGYGKYSNVAIAELVIFSETHTAAEISAMEAYLSTRA